MPDHTKASEAVLKKEVLVLSFYKCLACKYLCLFSYSALGSILRCERHPCSMPDPQADLAACKLAKPRLVQNLQYQGGLLASVYQQRNST